jgi:hypothetical protein
MKAISKSAFVPVSLGTSQTEQGCFSHESQGQVRDKLGTNRDKGHGTRVYRYAVPLSQQFWPADSAVLILADLANFHQ